MMNKENNATLSLVKEVDISNFIQQEICFPKISFHFDQERSQKERASNQSKSCLETQIAIALKWIFYAIKHDSKGVIIDCDFKVRNDFFKAELLIRTKLEFNKLIPEQQLFTTCFFQILASQFFFPHLVALVALNTEKIDFGICPIILDRSTLDTIQKATNSQGPFKRNSL